METTANAVTLKIDGMTGDACVQKVKAALNAVAGCTVESVKVGEATCTCNEASAIDGACAAVNDAGFKSSANRCGDRSDQPQRSKDSAKPQSKESLAMTSEGAGGAIGATPSPARGIPAAANKPH